ncbi:hypothetical protein CLAIMM_00108 [Cladophialophora immunda]|nr:hypothetical protein CLAIMM_00108 [Cladophialophora immunda]
MDMKFIRASDLAAMSSSSSELIMASVAFVVGLLSHQIFKRNEPSAYGCFGYIVGTNVAMAILSKALGIRTTTGLVQVAIIDLGIYIATILTSMTLYRVFFHPLNRFPGPLFCKITRFVATYHALQRDTHVWLHDLHEKYGDVVRVSPNELSYKSVTAVDAVHGSKAGNVARGPFYGGDPNRPANSMLSTQSLDEHRWRRKIWERGFGTLQLKAYESRVVRHLDVLVSQLRKREGAIVNMTEWCEFFAYDVMSDLGFSEEFGMLKAGKPHRYVSALHGNARIIFTVAQTPWMRPLLWLFPVDAQSKKDGRDFRKIGIETYQRRKARGDVKQQDMFETIANNPDSIGPRPLTEAEIMADASLIIMAGSTSTALCITFVFWYLCQHRAIYGKLQREIDRNWDGVSPLAVSQIGPGPAPYLNAVIEETLRIWPPAPGGTQRRSPDGGMVVDGEYVPKGTQVSVCPIAIQRDERYFSNPLEFIPERWVDDMRPPDFVHQPRAFIPFTVGQYTCLGKNLAYQEIRLFVAKVMRNLDFHFPPGYNPAEFEKTVAFKGTLLIGELPVIFTSRKD